MAIAAVICTGGVALVPMLTALFTAIGVLTGMAATVATVVGITIATIAVLSTIGSSVLNIIGTWKDMSGNSTFKKWQIALNITCAVSNGIYSLGEIFNLLSTKIGGVAKSGAGVVDDEIWKINEKFFDIQTSSGREIYLSHNPEDYVGKGQFYSKELQYLLDNGYRFIDEGGIWHAIR